jgi:hypothetical protein
MAFAALPTGSSLLLRHRGPALAEALRDAVYAAGAPDNLAIALLDRRAG